MQQTKSSNWVFAFVELHIKAIKGFHLPLILAWIWHLKLADRLLNFTVAISRGMTVNELKEPWNYKFMLDLANPEGCGHNHGSEHPHAQRRMDMLKEKLAKGVYKQKHVGFFRGIWNVIAFYLGMNVITTDLALTPMQQKHFLKRTTSSTSAASHIHSHTHSHSHQAAQPTNKASSGPSYIELSDLSQRRGGGSNSINTTDNADDEEV